MTDTIPFYISHFRTSYYDSFEKKLYGLFINREAYNWSYYPGVELATNVYSNNDYPELFDKYELTSETFKTNGLVRFEMTGCNNNWFTEVVDSIYQVIYKTHLRFTHRNATELGIPPVKSFMVIQTDDIVDDIYIHDRDIESGYIVKYPEFDFAFIRMAFDEQVEKDFNNLKNQLESYPYENKIVNYIRNKKYPNMTEGTYYYDILYVLPNDKVTSRRSIIAEWNGNYFSK